MVAWFSRSRFAAGLATVTIVGASLIPLTATPAPATLPSQVTITWGGCRGSTTTYVATGEVLPSTPFICADEDYTPGNLGKGWNEFDYVPQRLTTDVGTQAGATGTFDLRLTADYKKSGIPGYDKVTAPIVNTALSDAGCTITSGAQVTAADESIIYRDVHIVQPKGSYCVFDVDFRLAFGSHAYPGSSLHTHSYNENGGTQSVGSKDNSIPVNEILAPDVEKTMTATQGSAHDWSISKESTPLNLNISDTCDTSTGAREGTITVTVTWTKLSAQPGGAITVHTTVTVFNFSHRTLNYDTTDVVSDGATTIQTFTANDVPVPANSSQVVIDETFPYSPSGTPNLHDTATTFVSDPLEPDINFGPLTASATATVQNTGPVSFNSANISDVETLAGNKLEFAVADPGIGSFAGGYVPGTFKTGSVTWNLNGVTDSGSVVFTKTVRVTEPAITTGTLSDTATLTSTEGAQTLTRTANASSNISASASTTLTINKTIPDVLTGSETATFNFIVASGASCTDDGNDGCTNAVDTASITFTAGQTSKSVDVTGLAPGTYTVHEKTAANWQPKDDQTVTITLPSCAEDVSFENTFAPASAQVRKVTVPAGSEAGWQFTLTGPNTPPGGETVTTTGTGYVSFTTVLEEGSYTITETGGPPGWDQTGTSGDCSFTVNFPADEGKTFSCTFTNTQRGHVTVIKTQNGGVPTLGYTFCLSGGPDNLPTTNCLTTNGTNQGTLDFGSLKPGNYTLCEKNVPAGTDSTLVDQGGVLDPNTGDVCLNFTLDPGENQVFNVDNSFPLGGQRTIGYWKNWNTCAKADAAKALKTGNHLMDEFLPQNLGPYTVSTACQGVAVLKIASMKYAENGTAAQLLGAKLNVAAGASVCPVVTQAIQTANNLLTSIGYNGPVALPNNVVGSGHPLRSQFLAVHTTLDRYNNGLIC